MSIRSLQENKWSVKRCLQYRLSKPSKKVLGRSFTDSGRGGDQWLSTGFSESHLSTSVLPKQLGGFHVSYEYGPLLSLHLRQQCFHFLFFRAISKERVYVSVSQHTVIRTDYRVVIVN